MNQRQHPQVHTQESGTSMTAQHRWELFMKRCQLESSTKITLKQQAKLEAIPNDDLQYILQKINEGTRLRVIHRYLQEFFYVNIDKKALARYWRRTLHGYTQTEAQQRELRTAERALRQINQKDDLL